MITLEWTGEVLEVSDGLDVFQQSLTITKLPDAGKNWQVKQLTLWKLRQEHPQADQALRAAPYFSSFKKTLDLYRERQTQIRENIEEEASSRASLPVVSQEQRPRAGGDVVKGKSAVVAPSSRSNSKITSSSSGTRARALSSPPVERETSEAVAKVTGLAASGGSKSPADTTDQLSAYKTLAKKRADLVEELEFFVRKSEWSATFLKRLHDERQKQGSIPAGGAQQTGGSSPGNLPGHPLYSKSMWLAVEHPVSMITSVSRLVSGVVFYPQVGQKYRASVGSGSPGMLRRNFHRYLSAIFPRARARRDVFIRVTTTTPPPTAVVRSSITAGPPAVAEETQQVAKEIETAKLSTAVSSGSSKASTAANRPGPVAETPVPAPVDAAAPVAKPDSILPVSTPVGTPPSSIAPVVTTSPPIPEEGGGVSSAAPTVTTSAPGTATGQTATSAAPTAGNVNELSSGLLKVKKDSGAKIEDLDTAAGMDSVSAKANTFSSKPALAEEKTKNTTAEITTGKTTTSEPVREKKPKAKPVVSVPRDLKSGTTSKPPSSRGDKTTPAAASNTKTRGLSFASTTDDVVENSVPQKKQLQPTAGLARQTTTAFSGRKLLEEPQVAPNNWQLATHEKSGTFFGALPSRSLTFSRFTTAHLFLEPSAQLSRSSLTLVRTWYSLRNGRDHTCTSTMPSAVANFAASDVRGQEHATAAQSDLQEAWVAHFTLADKKNEYGSTIKGASVQSKSSKSASSQFCRSHVSPAFTSANVASFRSSVAKKISSSVDMVVYDQGADTVMRREGAAAPAGVPGAVAEPEEKHASEKQSGLTDPAAQFSRVTESKLEGRVVSPSLPGGTSTMKQFMKNVLSEKNDKFLIVDGVGDFYDGHAEHFQFFIDGNAATSSNAFASVNTPQTQMATSQQHADRGRKKKNSSHPAPSTPQDLKATSASSPSAGQEGSFPRNDEAARAWAPASSSTDEFRLPAADIPGSSIWSTVRNFFGSWWTEGAAVQHESTAGGGEELQRSRIEAANQLHGLAAPGALGLAASSRDALNVQTLSDASAIDAIPASPESQRFQPYWNPVLSAATAFDINRVLALVARITGITQASAKISLPKDTDMTKQASHPNFVSVEVDLSATQAVVSDGGLLTVRLLAENALEDESGRGTTDKAATPAAPPTDQGSSASSSVASKPPASSSSAAPLVTIAPPASREQAIAVPSREKIKPPDAGTTTTAKTSAPAVLPVPEVAGATLEAGSYCSPFFLEWFLSVSCGIHVRDGLFQAFAQAREHAYWLSGARKWHSELQLQEQDDFAPEDADEELPPRRQLQASSGEVVKLLPDSEDLRRTEEVRLRQEWLTFRDFVLFRTLARAPLFPLRGLSRGLFFVGGFEEANVLKLPAPEDGGASVTPAGAPPSVVDGSSPTGVSEGAEGAEVGHPEPGAQEKTENPTGDRSGASRASSPDGATRRTRRMQMSEGTTTSQAETNFGTTGDLSEPQKIRIASPEQIFIAHESVYAHHPDQVVRDFALEARWTLFQGAGLQQVFLDPDVLFPIAAPTQLGGSTSSEAADDPYQREREQLRAAFQEAVNFTKSVEDILEDAHVIRTGDHHIDQHNYRGQHSSSLNTHEAHQLSAVSAALPKPQGQIYGFAAFQFLQCPCHTGILNWRNPNYVQQTIEFTLQQALEIPSSEQYGIWLLETLPWRQPSVAVAEAWSRRRRWVVKSVHQKIILRMSGYETLQLVAKRHESY
ncbi:unnamed protein product [Amoebophrya sp. A120]|nr:unnamed protein product [Amoebophrya sp. A120]|eukprot:GSA120T00011465001.1